MTSSGKIASAKAKNKYEAANPARRPAWVACAVLGRKPCQVCGEVRTDRHHPDISKPLEIIHLCRLHHKLAHHI